VGSSSFGRRRGRPGLISTSSRPFLSFAFAAVQVTHFPFGFKMLVFFFFFFFFCGCQSSGKSSVLESVVGRDFLPRGSGNSSLLWC
jgi:hypothetical protein